jgi:hypothetical protein
VLRVALELRPSNIGDEALAAGVALAIDERDERAGRWKVRAAHQVLNPNGSRTIPRPGAHVMVPGLRMPRVLGTEEILLPPAREKEALLAWMAGAGYARLGGYGRLTLKQDRRRPSGAAPAAEIVDYILSDAPDVVLLGWGPPTLLGRLRESGFQGPVFLEWGSLFESRLAAYEGFRLLLSPLRPPPADFAGRHPHPNAYAGYRAALRYFDVLDSSPAADPLELALKIRPSEGYLDLRDEPRVYEVRNGRPEPSK